MKIYFMKVQKSIILDQVGVKEKLKQNLLKIKIEIYHLVVMNKNWKMTLMPRKKIVLLNQALYNPKDLHQVNQMMQSNK